MTDTDTASATTRVEPLQIFVGVDESQLLAFRVLEYSIRKAASIPVEVHPMLDFPGALPPAAALRSRTAFSFCRFTIPARCGNRGRALYLDADMLVFGDVAELAAMEFGPHAILRTEPGASADWSGYSPIENIGAQAAVMLLDCARLPWDADAIVAGLDRGEYSYEELMAELCIVDPSQIADAIPLAWNDLEHYDPATTKLIHYTVVPSQPWKNDTNALRDLWTAWFEEAVAAGAVPVVEIESLVAGGHVKASLLDAVALAPAEPDPRIEPLDREAALVALRRRIGELEAQIDVMKQSSTWRVGSAVNRAARVPVDWVHRVQESVRRHRAVS